MDIEKEQLVIEALLRESHSKEETEKEWRRLEKRIRQKSSDVWFMLKVAATVMAIVASATMLWFINESGREKGLVYKASTTAKEVVHTHDERTTTATTTATPNPSAASTSEWETIEVPAGKDYRITLPDGSEVWLNAETKLSYPSTFAGEKREVELSGEAYFKVKADKNHPFTVRTDDIRTRVTGTEFNVEARQGETQRVTLVSGSIDVTHTEAGQTVNLSPSESATISGKEIEVAQVNTDDVTCWREGIELSDYATLSEILIKIGRWYNLTVVCRDDEKLLHRLHFVYDRNNNVEKTLKSLSQISKTKIILENNVIFVE